MCVCVCVCQVKAKERRINQLEEAKYRLEEENTAMARKLEELQRKDALNRAKSSKSSASGGVCVCVCVCVCVRVLELEEECKEGRSRGGSRGLVVGACPSVSVTLEPLSSSLALRPCRGHLSAG